MSDNPYCRKDLLILSRNFPVREIAHFEPVVAETPDGGISLDFGQNLAGYVRIRLRDCAEGQKITLIHGEKIQDGDVYQSRTYQRA